MKRSYELQYLRKKIIEVTFLSAMLINFKIVEFQTIFLYTCKQLDCFVNLDWT